MEDDVFRGFLEQARANLVNQGVPASPHLVGLHARFRLRDGLAVSRDWSNIDHFIQLDLPVAASIVALVGPITSQTYYSSKQPVDQARAAAAGISLPGDLNQIIIIFAFPANESVKSLVRGPYPFLHYSANSEIVGFPRSGSPHEIDWFLRLPRVEGMR